jgi:hypothetical protein
MTGFSSLTPGSQVFASVTPGEIEDTAPAGSSADFKWIIGTALTATDILVNPYTDDPAAQ